MAATTPRLGLSSASRPNDERNASSEDFRLQLMLEDALAAQHYLEAADMASKSASHPNDLPAALSKLSVDNDNGKPLQKSFSPNGGHKGIGPPRSSQSHPEQQTSAHSSPKPRSVHIGSAQDPYSEAVADRNSSPRQSLNYSRPQPTNPLGLQNAQHGPNDEFALGRSEDVQTYVKQAPAVTHETRIVDTHEIVQEQVTREIHYHHIVHRVLPIHDLEVLPPRHFVPSNSGNGLREIQPPPNNEEIRESVRSAFATRLADKIEHDRRTRGKAVFDQRGQVREWISADGVACSESTWIHSPKLDTAAYDAGETVPLHLESLTLDDRPERKKPR